MRRAILFLLACLPLFAQAATTTIYPSWVGVRPSTMDFKPPSPVETLSHNWGVKSGWFWTSPNQGSLAMTGRMSASEAAGVYSAISGGAMASQAGAKSLAVSAIRALPGIALTALALDMGFEYLSGQWQTQIPANPNYSGTSPESSTPLSFPSYDAMESGVLAHCHSGCTAKGYFTGSKNGPYPVTGGYSYTCKCVQAGGIPTSVQWSFQVAAPTPASTRPTTEQDWGLAPSKLARNISDTELEDMIKLGYAVPIVAPPATVIGDFESLTPSELQFLQDKGYFTSPNGASFPMDSPRTDPITGQQSQTMGKLEAIPNGGVRVSTYETPLDASGNLILDQTGQPTKEAAKDECAGSNLPGCTPLGTGGDGPNIQEKTIALGNPGFGTSGSCPQPRSFTIGGNSYTFPFDAICDAAETYIKPLALVLAAISAYFIFVGGVRT